MAENQRTVRDNRVTIKLDRALGEAIESSLKSHPEWGMYSISEFVRRAVDREMDYRIRISGQKVLNIDIIPSDSLSDNRHRGL